MIQVIVSVLFTNSILSKDKSFIYYHVVRDYVVPLAMTTMGTTTKNGAAPLKEELNLQ